jgi:hypothetical protein
MNQSMREKFSLRRSGIVKDWVNAVKTFKVWKKKHLFRLHGPLLMGICLDNVRDLYAYQPYFHFHSLMISQEVISLDLCGPYLNRSKTAQQIPVSIHEMKFSELFNEFTSQYPLIQKSTLLFSDYIHTVKDVLLGKNRPFSGYLPHVYSNIILVSAYLGKIDYARAELDVFSEDLGKRKDFNINIIGSVDCWKKNIVTNINETHLKEIVKLEKEKHNLTGFADYGMEFDSPIRLLEE